MAEMSAFMCGGMLPAVELPDAGEGACCMGAVMGGPQHCTCWEPVFDLEQRQPQTGPMGLRAVRCHDCAYLRDSPERRGENGYQGDAESLEQMARDGSPFACHQGMRKPVKYVHPSGAEIPGHPAAYDPPVTGGVPYKADGSPGDLCAGWAARRLHYMTREAPGPSASAGLPAGEDHPKSPSPAGPALPAPFPSPQGAGTGSAAVPPPVGTADHGGTVKRPVRHAPGGATGPRPPRPGHPLSPPLVGGGEPGPSPVAPGGGPGTSPAGAGRDADRPAPAGSTGQDARDAWKREIAKQNADKRRRRGKRQEPGYRPGMTRRQPG